MSDRQRWRRAEARGTELARKAAPALITGGAGDDPAGIMTYTVVGGTTGMSQLWLLVLSTPVPTAAATSMAARVALVTQSGLAAVIENRYGRPVSAVIVLMLAVANIATIAADLSGVAAVLGMLTGIRWEIFVPLILLVLGIVLHSGYGKVK
jgi:Mn2+/Fe2+ NRAMP family transporter